MKKTPNYYLSDNSSEKAFKSFNHYIITYKTFFQRMLIPESYELESQLSILQPTSICTQASE